MENYEIIIKYLSGASTDEEEKELLDWLNESAENQKLFYDLKAIWQTKNNSKTIQKKDINVSLENLNKRIDGKTHRFFLSDPFRKIGLLIASVAAIFLVVYLGYSVSSQKESEIVQELIVYTNENDSIDKITLPDGSTVWLRNETRLSYSMDYNEKNRKVYLEGEALFEITKTGGQPFIVATENQLVQVLGTTFSVKTENPDFTETILLSGSVQLMNPSEMKLVTLQPGQQALYHNQSGDLEIHPVDAERLTAWRYELIMLSDVYIREIIESIEETYQVRVQMDTTSIKGHKYNFSFYRLKDVDETLERLSFMTGVPAKKGKE